MKYLICFINYGGNISGSQDAIVSEELLESIMNKKTIEGEIYDLQGTEQASIGSATSGQGVYLMP